ncbi:hypothetical protein [Nonomuraea candida]|uniref:hypothetical protein n=1 Tax=Nonomuraea candida TaxID=359159 RepID=UPI0005B811DC|nr:hypothetical protein [Nonomuraea candida]
MAGVKVKGISYACDGVPGPDLRRDLRVIRDDLHCTAVMLIGKDERALLTAAEAALGAGLGVYLRPDLAGRSRAELLAGLARTAGAAEALRERHPDRVTFVLGTEFSVTMAGMVPGPGVFFRLRVLIRWGRFFRRRITRELGALLGAALATVRREFRGPVTYAAGYWEQVDWSAFDLAGVNLYRMGADPAAYEARLRALLREAGKPVVITEFGCGAHVGAERRGPGSFLIVNWFADPPRVKAGHVRDEGTQARYLAELIELYGRHGVHGCFVFTFAMADFPHREDPRDDLDMAGFGVVKVAPGEPGSWARKEAFDEVARRYAAG